MITITPENPHPIVSSPGVEFDSRILVDTAIGRSAAIRIDVKIIPESFLRGMADCENGRVIDMERAMDEKPPHTN
jgi:hypothetical protein